MLKDNIWLRKKDEEFIGVGGQNVSDFLLKLWNSYDHSLFFSACASKKHWSRRPRVLIFIRNTCQHSALKPVRIHILHLLVKCCLWAMKLFNLQRDEHISATGKFAWFELLGGLFLLFLWPAELFKVLLCPTS